MNDFFQNIAPEIVSTLAVAVAALLTSLLSAKLGKEVKGKKQGYKDKFFTNLDKKFASKLISNKSDIQILLNSTSREFEDVYSISSILEDYITNKIEGDDESNIEKYNLLKTIIEEENKSKPFEDLPDEERRLLIGIKKAIENNDIENLDFNVNELHAVISTRNRIYEKASRLNKWSIPLAIAGTFFTILFGILSLKPASTSEFKRLEQMNKDLMIEIQDLKKSEEKTTPNNVQSGN